MEGYTVDLNPTSMAASVAWLLSTLAVTVSAINDLRRHREQPLMDDFCTECETLHQFLSDLEQILVAYAKSWASSNNPHLQIPLDPMLHTWISNCTLTLLGLQEEATRVLEMENQEDESIQSAPKKVDCTDGSEELSFDRLYQEMKTQNTNLDNFLPIMKVDLDGFLKDDIAQATFTPKVADNEAFPTGYRHQSNMERIRSALYSLSDEIKDAETRLNKCSSSFSDNANDELVLLQQDQSVSVKALAEVLTNNGSEWIESMLAGKMTFGEFSRLSPSRILDYSSIYAHFNLDLRADAAERWSWRNEGGARVNARNVGKERLQEMRSTVGELNRILKAGTSVANG
ncbi:MAG: hypothetical protein M1830_010394 [Pleopsidium flavum]|nr:MAG: hypothetical protein M1830_010394 [Pleopsidium flavum]